MNEEIKFCRSKMKEHFKFFSNNSPELKKRKAGSHSPPKKNVSKIMNKKGSKRHEHSQFLTHGPQVDSGIQIPQQVFES